MLIEAYLSIREEISNIYDRSELFRKQFWFVNPDFCLCISNACKTDSKLLTIGIWIFHLHGSYFIVPHTWDKRLGPKLKSQAWDWWVNKASNFANLRLFQQHVDIVIVKRLIWIKIKGQCVQSWVKKSNDLGEKEQRNIPDRDKLRARAPENIKLRDFDRKRETQFSTPEVFKERQHDDEISPEMWLKTEGEKLLHCEGGGGKSIAMTRYQKLPSSFLDNFKTL